MISARVTTKKIHNVENGVTVGIQKAIEEVAIAIEGQAVLLLDNHVRTGVLRGSITRASGDNKNEMVVGSNVEYAIYMEEGTRFMPAANQGKGYFKPAVERVKTRLSAIVGRIIRAEIRSN